MIPGLLGRKTLLSKREQELRARERELLDRLEAALERVEPAIDPTDARHLDAARTQLDQLFLIVVAGEFNSGKSSFVNALLGERPLPEGVTPRRTGSTCSARAPRCRSRRRRRSCWSGRTRPSCCGS